MSSNAPDPTASLPSPDMRQPDLMNDPIYVPEPKPDEVCRICRGEGNSDEPLFYPCKCSGSIKFVHQECLMEWLSHSQKKYCELCKTPFRFTKLYHPQMPRHLPATVFCRRALVHVLSYLLTWCRALLVGFVWLVCLPLAMRMVWRWLFWVGDAGWARDARVRRLQVADLSTQGQPSELASVVSSISSAFESNVTAAAEALPEIISSFSKPSNMTTGEHTAFAMLQSLFFKFNIGPYSSVPLTNVNGSAVNTTVNLVMLQHSSLLSEITFFSSFSSSPFVNRVVLDIFEGQIITILVVAAFILIFLIREWVVQQQPVQALLGRADQNPAERADRIDADDAHVDGHDNPDFDPDIHAPADDEVANGEEFDHDPPVPDRDWLANLANVSGPEDQQRDTLAQTDEHVHDHPVSSVFDHRHGFELDSGRSQNHDSSVETGQPLVVDGAEDRAEELDAGASSSSADAPTDRHLKLSRLLHEMAESLPNELREKYLRARRIEDVIENMRGAPVEEIEAITERILALSRDLNTQLDEYRRDTDEQLHSDADSSDMPGSSGSILVGNSPGAESLTTSYEDEARFGASTIRPRPNMPSRERSSIATEIRRDIEESDHSSSNVHIQTVAENGDEDQAEDPQSEGSSESWQHVSDLDGESAAKSAAAPQSADEVASSEQTRQTQSSAHFGRRAVDVNMEEHDSPISEFSDSTSEDSERNDHHMLDIANANIDTAPNASPSPIPDLAHDETTAFELPTDALDNHFNLPEDDMPEALPAPIPPAPAPPAGILDHVLDWLWGDVAPPENDIVGNDGGNVERIVGNIAEEDPFVPFAVGEQINNANDLDNALEQDPEVAAAAAEAGIDLNDQDAVDDAEDLEGILELIGMQGPITGLFQNAIFSAVLIAATLVGAIGIPYVCGKFVLFVLGNPVSVCIKLPLQLVSSFADLVVDLSVAICSAILHTLLSSFHVLVNALGLVLPIPSSWTDLIADFANAFSSPIFHSWERMYTNFSRLEAFSDFLWFSVSSHAALRMIQSQLSAGFHAAGQLAGDFLDNITDESIVRTIPRRLYGLLLSVGALELSFYKRIYEFGLSLWNAKTLRISLDFAHVTYSSDVTLQYWDAKDRVIATLAGYSLFALAGVVYQKRLLPITTSEQGRKVEGIISEILQQTGGVFKVILIISIEMIAFPLYCGILLDIAMLPLFAGATFKSRLDFAVSSPWTAGFVHWFVGTCYMFHFALFVSMCRKIMRRGVLYFIRDPDDPTFHPVRDVLERNVTTQLRKITFSAMVYGALIIVCLGGVVWAMDFGFQSILPIHWTTNSPALEFPLDLLFYNFLTPLVIRVLKPSDALHSMYAWWFRTCASMLRLSDFLFGTRPRDEEGHHVRRTWRAWLRREKGDVRQPVIGAEHQNLMHARGVEAYFLFDGRFVRAPASDQVRIPKGENVFVDVDQHNNRLDNVPEEDSGVHARNSAQTTMVYIPPHFRLRIAVFIFTLWLFAAATGVGVTVVPLLLGRKAFSFLAPQDWQVNDIYAFSFGAYFLGSIAYLVAHLRSAYTFFRTSPPHVYFSTFASAYTSVRKYTLRALSVFYLCSFIVVVIPLFFAVLVELYILIPLHTYLGPKDTHVVHLVQDWTLGFLYARIAYRIVFSDRNSRPARALQAVVQNGYMNPNAKLATRCFVLPLTMMFLALLLGPMLPYKAMHTFVLPRLLSSDLLEDPELHRLLTRYTYPVMLTFFLVFYASRETGKAVSRWRRVIKDEVYLIGERLHNFNETRPGPMTGALGKVVAEAGGARQRREMDLNVRLEQ